MRRTSKKQFTAGQMALEKILNDMGLMTVLEYPVGPYTLDIYLPEVNKAVEFDGPMHNHKRDARRDAWLLENKNIEVFRVSDIQASDLIENLTAFVS